MVSAYSTKLPSFAESLLPCIQQPKELLNDDKTHLSIPFENLPINQTMSWYTNEYSLLDSKMLKLSETTNLFPDNNWNTFDYDPSLSFTLQQPSVAAAQATSALQQISNNSYYECKHWTTPSDPIKEYDPNLAQKIADELGVSSETGQSSRTSDGAGKRNAWGRLSYADLIGRAIESSPERRLTLAQIYEWMIRYVPYFKDKGDKKSSVGWKNSVRHNLSLHEQFVRIRGSDASKTSWWTLNHKASQPDNLESSTSRQLTKSNSNHTKQTRKRRKKTLLSIFSNKNQNSISEQPISTDQNKRIKKINMEQFNTIESAYSNLLTPMDCKIDGQLDNASLLLTAACSLMQSHSPLTQDNSSNEALFLLQLPNGELCHVMPNSDYQIEDSDHHHGSSSNYLPLDDNDRLPVNLFDQINSECCFYKHQQNDESFENHLDDNEKNNLALENQFDIINNSSVDESFLGFI